MKFEKTKEINMEECKDCKSLIPVWHLCWTCNVKVCDHCWKKRVALHPLPRQCKCRPPQKNEWMTIIGHEKLL